jgi:hypothetical protein
MGNYELISTKHAKKLAFDATQHNPRDIPEDRAIRIGFSDQTQSLDARHEKSN